MTRRKWKRILRVLKGPKKRDRQAEQRRSRRTERQQDPEESPKREPFWRRWNIRNHT